MGVSGSMASTLGADNPFRYRGYYFDEETGLYYLNARYYNPEWSRFVNADTYGGSTGKLLGHNIFAYCSNNPVIKSDPSGNREMISYDTVTEDRAITYEKKKAILRYIAAGNPNAIFPFDDWLDYEDFGVGYISITISVVDAGFMCDYLDSMDSTRTVLKVVGAISLAVAGSYVLQGVTLGVTAAKIVRYAQKGVNAAMTANALIGSRDDSNYYKDCFGYLVYDVIFVWNDGMTSMPYRLVENFNGDFGDMSIIMD